MPQKITTIEKMVFILDVSLTSEEERTQSWDS